MSFRRVKKQNVVACSTAKVEYRAMTHTCELIWLRSLLQELHLYQHTLMKLYCDNKFIAHIPNNPISHKRTKHSKVDCHFIWENIERKEIITLIVRSQDQFAYIFTKDFGLNQLLHYCSKIGVCHII